MKKQEELTKIPFRFVGPKKLLDLKKMLCSHSYSLTVWHVEAVKDMARAMHTTEADIVRQAIERMQDKLKSEKTKPI